MNDLPYITHRPNFHIKRRFRDSTGCETSLELKLGQRIIPRKSITVLTPAKNLYT
jgi:hypothetical protein